MAYDVVRVYKNYSDDIIRIDDLSLSPVLKAGTATSGPVLVSPKRSITTNTIRSSGLDSDRTVGSIEITGSFTDQETTSGNYEWVSWNTGTDDTKKIYMQMSDLPKIGDLA